MKYGCLFFSILLLLSCSTTKTSSTKSNTSANSSPQADYFAEDYLRYDDHIYMDDVRSVKLFQSDDQMTYPILFMGDNKQLTLSFDVMGKELENYNFSFVHCDANWEPSILTQPEYLSGFPNGFIEEYLFSFNTLQPYVNYQLKFPNRDFSFRKSGNYLLKVYANNDESQLLLTKQFYIVDNKVEIEATVKPATLARHRDYKHEVDFSILYPNYTIIDPYRDIIVVIRQNFRWDNAITGLKPLFMKGNELEYNYEDKNLFWAGNEFRNFDLKDLRYQSINVGKVAFEDDQKTHAYLFPEISRSSQRYLFQPDLNGQYLIKRDDSRDSFNEADYAKVHFQLNYPQPLANGNLYVFGRLTNWEFMDEFKMQYDYTDKAYKAAPYLKQGYYNYQYIFLPDGAKEGDALTIEGSHFETQNNYYIFVYHRPQGTVYDQLICLYFNE